MSHKMGVVRLKDGTTVTKRITNIERDGYSTYGRVRYQNKIWEVCRDTTIHNADGSITYQWGLMDIIPNPNNMRFIPEDERE